MNPHFHRQQHQTEHGTESIVGPKVATDQMLPKDLQGVPIHKTSPQYSEALGRTVRLNRDERLARRAAHAAGLLPPASTTDDAISKTGAVIFDMSEPSYQPFVEEDVRDEPPAPAWKYPEERSKKRFSRRRRLPNAAGRERVAQLDNLEVQIREMNDRIARKEARGPNDQGRQTGSSKLEE